MPTNEDQLRGWKEIAAFLQTSERTAQRWEAESHLPIHRPLTRRGTVYAQRDELIGWLGSSAGRAASGHEPETQPVVLDPAALPPLGSPDPRPDAGSEATSAAPPAERRLFRRMPRVAFVLFFLAALAGAIAGVLALRASDMPPTDGASEARDPSESHSLLALRFTWADGSSSRVNVRDGTSALVTVGEARHEVTARLLGETVGVSVWRVPSGGGAKSLVARFTLPPGTRGEVLGPLPFAVEWLPPQAAARPDRR